MEQINQAIKRTELVEKPEDRSNQFSGELETMFAGFDEEINMMAVPVKGSDIIRAVGDIGERLVAELEKEINLDRIPYVAKTTKRIIDFLAEKTLEAIDWIP